MANGIWEVGGLDEPSKLNPTESQGEEQVSRSLQANTELVCGEGGAGGVQHQRPGEPRRPQVSVLPTGHELLCLSMFLLELRVSS